MDFGIIEQAAGRSSRATSGRFVIKAIWPQRMKSLTETFVSHNHPAGEGLDFAKVMGGQLPGRESRRLLHH